MYEEYVSFLALRLFFLTSSPSLAGALGTAVFFAAFLAVVLAGALEAVAGAAGAFEAVEAGLGAIGYSKR
jgi:hypothetical protein